MLRISRICIQHETNHTEEIMKLNKLFIPTAIMCLFATAAVAQSSKATAAINTVSVSCPSNSTTATTSCSTGWTNVMKSTIKTSNIADLFVSPSLVTGLYTSTQVKGNGTGSTSSATAMGTVEVRVVLDPVFDSNGNVVSGTFGQPDKTGSGVIFDQRIQTLTANLGNIFTDCIAQGGVDCTLTPEQITLALDTTSAHSFNFILLNVGTGNHTIVLQSRVASDSATTSGGGVAISNALYGLGSLTVESARLVNSFSF
jgi:hypothetical protein